MASDTILSVRERPLRKAAAPRRKRAALPRDGARTRRQIFDAAFAEFARGGFSGARMDKIAARAKCNIQMIYHHFGNKARLYEAVIEAAYGDIRGREQELRLEDLEPVEALTRLAEFTFDYFRANPGFVSLLNSENLTQGKFVLKSKRVTELTLGLRAAIARAVRQGIASGRLRPDADPVQIYVTIAALGWFHISNAYTLSAMFGADMTDESWRDRRRQHVRQVLRAYLLGRDED